MGTFQFPKTVRWAFKFLTFSIPRKRIKMRRKLPSVIVLTTITAVCLISESPVHQVAGIIPWFKKPARVLSHGQLTNKEKWMDLIKSNPIGKLYNFYHEAKEVGIDVTKFSIYEYGDHPNEQTPHAKAFRRYKNTEFGNEEW